FDGMPRSAIKTGLADFVLPVVRIPEVLVKYGAQMHAEGPRHGIVPDDNAPSWLGAIIDLLRTRTAHDFSRYKPGTLQRRIERRMAMAGIIDGARYLDLLGRDPAELDRLAKDLLINVTSFFRDPKAFDLLADEVVADLVRQHEADRPLRIWVAGCSTGEETYSIAILFLEAIAASKRTIALQVFASDVDGEAVAFARNGIYPETIAADVSPARLARFFIKQDHSYRIALDLRGLMVFTTQDVLADPPFSRLDLVSCRNLLIYLRPEAQAKVVSAFHFALREGGVLLLGSSETVGAPDGRFEIISKPLRVYRHIAQARPGEFGFPSGVDGLRAPARPGQSPVPSRQAVLADLCRRLVMEEYAPASVLINRKQECLFSLGRTDRYLQVPPGLPSHDLLSMAREGVRTKLRSAVQQATHRNERVRVSGGRMIHDGEAILFGIDVQPVASDGEELLLVCFVAEPEPADAPGRPTAPDDVARVAELRQELEATRAELQDAIRNLEISSEEQKAINEEALSVNEEFQSTNEELVTSKEELQSVNEELIALNNQLQETLDRQRTLSNDLQNVLYSTDVATLFLDAELRIRFFTPATKSLFNIIPSDIGRPLADLASLVADSALLTDARKVLQSPAPVDREIEARSGAWFMRRILPYRTQDNHVEGVVITFSEITERKQAAKALEAARQQAELANATKSRFLAAASHDLRQPLQTLALLQGLLAKNVEGDRAARLVARFDETLGAMSGMLNTLLNINQIETGTVRAEPVDFPLDELFDRLRDEFTYHAQAKRLRLRVVGCSMTIHSDPRILEQMIRNILANALKYTKSGKVLLGCRRRGGLLSIEVWDTGIGIPEEELQAIFEEYHQLDNQARESSRGLGLGLSIVRRLGNLLAYRVRVQSRPGKGSCFAIETGLPTRGTVPRPEPGRDGREDATAERAQSTGAILVVEDDPAVRDLLDLFLKDEGYRTAVAVDGIAALDLVARGTIRPDLVLADYNLPNGMDGLVLIAKLRDVLHRQVPAIILTGDTTTRTLREVALHDCVQLNKPVKLKELTQVIQRLLLASRAGPGRAAPAPAATSRAAPPVIFVVDDDANIREAVRAVLEDAGRTVEDFGTSEAFLGAYRPGREACLLIDAYLPGMDGFELLRRLSDAGHRLPSIMITGNSDVPMAVRAMKAGALDFIEKPISRDTLIASVEHALELSRDSSKLAARHEDAASHVAGLTPRQREIMDLVLAGHPSKNIAADLGISQRTVENHRASIMKKTGSRSLPALARLAVAAGNGGDRARG
ncbi:MAG TPA: CheR family methyltransferase, partial [Stellaceae bacterium]|nr:CheR family methyltransferase [Stellaceae bacterium]